MRHIVKAISNFIAAVVFVLVLFTFILTIVGFMGGLDWRFDLANHFRPYYFLIEGAALALFVFLGKKRLAAGTLLFLVANASQLYPLYLKQSSNASGSQIKVVQFNVCAPARNYEPMSHFLFSEKPDLVVLEECGDRCVAHLVRDQAIRQYPYVFRKVPHRHRLLVLSHYPLKPLPLPALTADPAVAFLQVDMPGKPVSLFAMHSTRPSSGAPYYRNQIAQFRQIANLTRRVRGPFLMIGDLNVTPWSYSFGLLMRESRLRNSMSGFGFHPTFPTFVPHFERFPVLPLIPIDHVLISPEFTVENRHTGPVLQSDHLPVVATLALK